ncbi:hypothetical protein [Microbacterium algeriense]|uniref:hypothetical protein n=1 Tax=Microbacterium algeriense TaxID=2615184 RepID=UPI0029A7F58B|nr:hypothetical protein [Microbacterium algeriense]MDX2399980.1 hypothetical protein [Microbacterium algeriense]
MSTSHRRSTLAAAPVAGLLLLSACTAASAGSAAPTSTTAPSDQRLEEAHPRPPEKPVIGMGTVMDVGGDVQLCLGAVAESYPPQCSGVPLDGWSWDDLEGSESSGQTTWGAYAVSATFDGERLESTEPPMLLALYDPLVPEDPTGGVAGTTPDEELARVQEDVFARLDDALTAWSDRGYVWVQVVWDDGSLQEAVDAEYGDDVVVVQSALREIG